MDESERQSARKGASGKIELHWNLIQVKIVRRASR